MLGLGAGDLRGDVALVAPVRADGAVLCQDGIAKTAEPSSFKDRGAEVLLAACALRGVNRVVADSSGNAGVAIARAAARRGIAAHVVVPRSTPSAKLDAMRAHHAEVEIVAGDREAAHQRAVELARRTAYASHIFQPFFHAGVASLAWDLALALGDRIPSHLYLPVGNGSLLLGMLLGWQTLTRHGLAPPPIIHAVQLRGYSTLAPNSEPDSSGSSIPGPPRAAGIAIAHPPRLADLEAAVASHGDNVTVVSNDDIASAEEELGQLGIRCDATGAAAFAGWKREGVVGSGEAAILVTSKR